MRLPFHIILFCLPLLTAAQKAENTANQPPAYFSKPEALQTAGVKWVNCIYKDSRNLMWFGTSNGLFRFDGTNVLHARYKTDDSLTLPANEVRSIAEDKEGNMWIGTDKGGVMMDANTFTCTRVRDMADNYPGWKHKFFADPQGDIWAATDAGLYKYNKQKQRLQMVWAEIIPGNSISGYVISMASYSKDVLVIGTSADVVFINKKDFSYKRVPLFVNNNNITANKVYVDAGGELWVGTWGYGLFHFNKTTQSFNLVPWQKNIPAIEYYVITDVTKVTVNGKYYIYAGTNDAVIKIPLLNDGITPADGGQAYYIYQPGTEGSMAQGGTGALFPDESGNLWIGCTGDIGVVRTALSESLLYTLPTAHAGQVEDIEAVNAGNKNYYAVCSWHGDKGLVLLDESFNEVKTFAHLPEGAGDDAVNISSVFTDTKHRIWVSSWKGITVMDNNFKVLKTLDHTTRGPDTLFREKNNYAIISNDTVWIANYKNGIDLFNTDFKRLKHYSSSQGNGLLEDLVWKFYRSANGTIWLIGNAFIYKYDAAADRFIHYHFSKDGASYSPVDIAEKKDGTLLVATAVGLVHFNPANGQYVYINSPLLDKEDDINAVCTDENDNAWYLTDEHLVHYDFNTNVFTLYGKQDGLNAADGMYKIRYLGNNRLLIGQENKILLFNSPLSTKKIKAPSLLVTGLYINDSLVSSVLPGKLLNLPHNQNRINIAFACVNYTKPEQNIFAYRLKNADTAWTFTRQGNVSYANLSPGHYVFEVKAANYALVWSSVNSISINIDPPFWQTWWFRVVMLCLAASGTYFVFRWRVGNIRREEKIKTNLTNKMAQLEMKALRAQMNPHFVFNSLSSIQESIVTGKADAASRYLSKFSKLIRLIFENSGKQFISLKTEIESLTLYLELESFRFENFTYTISIDPSVDAYFTNIPSMVIQPFVENALKHGLSKKKDDKHLKIEIRREHGQLVAIVEDNGIGRTKAAEMKSLERQDHHSMGIEITQERLQLLGLQNPDQATVITDLFDKAGNAEGTVVKIILPVEN